LREPEHEPSDSKSPKPNIEQDDPPANDDEDEGCLNISESNDE
jgi:hypothetical protein